MLQLLARELRFYLVAQELLDESDLDEASPQRRACLDALDELRMTATNFAPGEETEALEGAVLRRKECARLLRTLGLEDAIRERSRARGAEHTHRTCRVSRVVRRSPHAHTHPERCPVVGYGDLSLREAR